MVETLLEALHGTHDELEICWEAFTAIQEHGDEKIARLLLERGVSPSFSMLCQACSAGLLEMVRLLLESGIGVNEDDDEDGPLLHVAAYHSRPQIVQLLIHRGADITLRSTRYGSPMIATLEGSMVPFLQGYRQPNSCRALANQLPLSRPLYGRFGPDRNQGKPSYKEISQCEQVLQSLFDAGVEVDTSIRNFGNALHLTSHMGSEKIVRQLLERMDGISIFGGYFGSPLIAALEGDHQLIVTLLLNRDIDVNRSSPQRKFALHYACGQGNKTLIQNLLSHNTDINACHEKHGAALAAAVSSRPDPITRYGNNISIEKRRTMIELLLRHEPRVHIRENDLLAVASLSDGNCIMGLIFDHDPSAVVTEAIIVRTIEKSNSELLSLLLKRDGGLGTTQAMLKVATESWMVKILLEHKPVCQVTPDIIENAAGQHFGGFDIIATNT